MQEKFKRVTVINEDGSVKALHARFIMFLKKGEGKEKIHALLAWYENHLDAEIDRTEHEGRFVVPLSQVFFDDTPEW